MASFSGAAVPPTVRCLSLLLCLSAIEFCSASLIAPRYATLRLRRRAHSPLLTLQDPDENGFDLHSAERAAADQQGRLRKGPLPPPTPRKAPSLDDALRDGALSPVYLVGVGPGDVELLTIKALRLMQRADLVLYDRLIAPEILELVGPQARMLYVGKEAGLHTRKQDEIHALLLHFASTGRTVVRLKGGDPTVFGRGGEEMEYLAAKGVDTRIVPGITAAAGIAAGLGLPLTHRDFADSVRFITGHARSENSAPVDERYPWAQLADPSTTLVIYMGLATLPELAAGLLHAGLSRETPAVAVQDGTTVTQRVVAAPLHALPGAVAAAELRSPTLVLIGNIVSLLDGEATASEAHAVPLRAADVLRSVQQARSRDPTAKPWAVPPETG
jgi:uroporphyrin-III C-methyltransferase